MDAVAPPQVSHLPVLVLSPHNRCNCRCVMCDIWKTTESRELSAADLETHLDSIDRLGVEWIVFSGGEPLMHSELFRLCALLKQRQIRLTLLSTGLLLERRAAEVVAWFDDVIVSLDGPPAVHDAIRGVPSAFGRLEAGVKAIHGLSQDFPLAARCTIQRLNCGVLDLTVQSARALGLAGISFLAADTVSEAFNHPLGWKPASASRVALTAEEIPILEEQIEWLIQSDEGGGFIAESPEKLRRIVRHFRAGLGQIEPVAPACNAPWVSAVVEADGTVRPCFFHPPVGRITYTTSLADVINSPQAMAFRQNLNVAANPICRRCVCALKRPMKPSPQ
jgi:MoaA/NifB/PqqE/SkfB family radical SAM enzyme